MKRLDTSHSLVKTGNESVPELYTSAVRAVVRVVSDSVETPSRELSIIRIIKTIDDPRYHCATRIIIAVRDDRSASYQTLELSPTFVLLSYTRRAKALTFFFRERRVVFMRREKRRGSGYGQRVEER